MKKRRRQFWEKKQKKQEKKHVEKVKAKFSTSLILKIIKLIKIILKKIITKKKIMWGNTVAIHGVLKKKTTKLNSQPP
jgi:hypothetical protein